MGNDTPFTIDQVNDDKIVLKNDSVELSLPPSLFSNPVAVGDKMVLGVNTETEFNQMKAKSAKEVLQELIKEE